MLYRSMICWLNPVELKPPTAIGQNIVGTVVKPYVILGGAYNPTTNVMKTTLAENGLLPTSSSGVSQPDINTLTVDGARVVDWVGVIFSRASAPGTPVLGTPALLLSNGKVVTAGSTHGGFNFTGVAGNYVLTIIHRNHISVAENLLIPIVPMPTIDIDLSNIGAPTTAQKTIGNIKAMWPGDTDGDGEATTADLSAIKKDFQNGLFDDYLTSDLDFDTEVSTADINLVSETFSSGVYFDYGDLPQ